MTPAQVRLEVSAILGPTATGKTRIAVALAPLLPAEIVSIDSMQVYRGMDIGTAKPEPRLRDLVPHHMLDIVEASEDFSAARFQARAREAVEDISARGKIPLLVGGAGLYFEAVVFMLRFPPGQTDGDLRRKLRREAAEDLEGLKKRLARVDPAFAASVDFANPRRVVRAMEVYELTGLPFSSFRYGRGKLEPCYEFRGVVLNAPRQALYRAIDRRVDDMFAKGLVEEVRGLRAGRGLSRTARQALGYKEVLDHLDRGISLEDTINNVKRRSRNYAKRQLTWFRRIQGLSWIELEENDLLAPSDRVQQVVLERLRGRGGE